MSVHQALWWSAICHIVNVLAQSAPIEVEVKPEPQGGLFVAAVDVGTPPQRIWAGLDTASEWLWLPEAVPGAGHGGFSVANSSSASVSGTKSAGYADGTKIDGHILKDNVLIGNQQVSSASMLLAENISGDAGSSFAAGGGGLLGLLASSGKAEASAWSWSGRDKKDMEGSFLDEFWRQHAEVPRTLRLELGALRPRLLLGVLSSNSALRGPTDTTLLGTTFSALASNWYVSTRAIGLSSGKEGPWLSRNVDFNAVLPLGAPTLLDSGSSSIRFGTGVWEHFVLGMPEGCQREDTGAMGCPCKLESIEEDFPTISISFETMATFRILGLDSGADKIICIPPHAYVSIRADKANWCDLAIVDAGQHHTMFGLEAIVLGVPFFRSANVLLDVENRVVGVEPVSLARSGEKVGLDVASASKKDVCKCADPKNWWRTGKRFSPKRVVVALMLVSMIASYVFVGFSQTRTAESLRVLLEGIIGPMSPGAAQRATAGDNRPGAPPLLQMANRGPE